MTRTVKDQRRRCILQSYILHDQTTFDTFVINHLGEKGYESTELDTKM